MTHDPAEADRALLQAVRDGRPGAFEQLVRTHQRLVWHIVQRLVRDPEETRELCQDTFLRVHRRLHQFRGESRLATWIGRIAYSISLRHLERRRIALVDLDPGEDEGGHGDALESVADSLDLEARAADAQAVRRLHAAIDRLAPLPRTLLTLHYLEEWSIAEITGLTGLPAGTIKSHLFRSRRVLREALGPSLDSAPDPSHAPPRKPSP